MSTSVEEAKDSDLRVNELEKAAEAELPPADAVDNDALLKESKKGLFGRSAEFLKSPDASAMEIGESNGHANDEASGCVEKGRQVDTDVGDGDAQLVAEKESDTDEKKEERVSIADELAACDTEVVQESPKENADSVVISYKKTVTVTEEVIEQVEEDKESEVAVDKEVEESADVDTKEGDQEDGSTADVSKANAEDAVAPEENINPELEETAESSPKKGKRTRQKKVMEEDPMNERRRSLRTPKPAPAPAPANVPVKAATEKVARKPATKGTKDSVSTPVRSSGKKKEEKPGESTPVKKTASTSKAASAKRTRSSESEKKKKAEQKPEESPEANDPFNISNIDNHPVILSNIQIHSAQFGSMKFTKTSPGTSHGRYEKTEQTAGERRSNLVDMAPSQLSPRKSLSELSESTSKQRRASSSKGKRAAVKVANESAGQGGEAVETDESPTPKSVKKSRSAKTPQTAKKTGTPSRKRTRSANATPVSAKQQKIEPKMPELSPDEQYVADHRENDHMPYMIGARVYALWNREYYSAVITADFDAAGRYGVTFVQDQLFRKLVITGIIPLQALVAGVKVYASDPEIPEKDAKLEEVEIVSPPSEDHQKWAEGVFRVKVCETSKEYDVQWDKFWFSLDEAKVLQTAKFNSVTDVITDNIDSNEGRRTRASRHSFAPEAASSPSVAKSAKRKLVAQHSEKVSESPTTVEIGLTERQAKQAEAEAEIFANISFVVTSAMRKVKEEEQGSFSKREIRQMIEGCGGNVVEDFTKIPSGSKMFLIADTHYRTHKYLSALARSVPCVSHRWIRDCVEQGELLDYKSYMLPAGVSLLTNKLTPWHQSNNTLLSGKRVYIYTRNMIPDQSVPNFVQIWSPLVAQMGATVLNEIPKDGLDILLTDASCTEDIIQQARRCNALVVSSEWIIQAIIEGSLPDPTAHERFRYDFVERPEGM